jgi:hypothetical protein
MMIHDRPTTHESQSNTNKQSSFRFFNDFRGSKYDEVADI